jgi:hypothetical protein
MGSIHFKVGTGYIFILFNIFPALERRKEKENASPVVGLHEIKEWTTKRKLRTQEKGIYPGRELQSILFIGLESSLLMVLLQTLINV